MLAPSRFGLDCFQSNIRKHVLFCRSPRCTWELSHSAGTPPGTHLVASASLPLRPLLPAARAPGSRPPSSASYPALRLRRRVGATKRVVPPLRKDLLGCFL